MSISMSELAAKFSAAASKADETNRKQLAVLSQVGVGYVKDEIQGMHAVDTGTMLNSTIAEQVNDLAYLIGPTVLYAPYVALGTSRVEARPFHIAAAHRLEKDVKESFKPEDYGL